MTTTKKETPKPAPAKKSHSIEDLRDEVIKLENEMKVTGTYTADAQNALNTVLGIIDKYR